MRLRPNLAALAALALGLTTMAGGLPARADGDPAAGKKVFNKCRACHTLEEGQNRVGPSLHGIIGRPAGSVEGFKYSDALKTSGVTWTEDNLEEYLADPRGFIPGNRMIFVGLKDEEDIENLIAYLEAEAM